MPTMSELEALIIEPLTLLDHQGERSGATLTAATHASSPFDGATVGAGAGVDIQQLESKASLPIELVDIDMTLLRDGDMW